MCRGSGSGGSAASPGAGASAARARVLRSGRVRARCRPWRSSSRGTPRRRKTRNGSSWRRSPSRTASAPACAHGSSPSAHEHLETTSPASSGRSERPVPWKALSTSSGRRPARRSAAYRARAAIALRTRRRTTDSSGRRESDVSSRCPPAARTSARAPVRPISSEVTAPERAAARPSVSASSQPSDASRARKRYAHPLSGGVARGRRAFLRRGISALRPSRWRSCRARRAP